RAHGADPRRREKTLDACPPHPASLLERGAMSAKPFPALTPADAGPDSADPAQLTEDPRVTQALEEYLTALEAGQLPDRTPLQARSSGISDMLGHYLRGLEFLPRTAAKPPASPCGAPAGLGRVPPGGQPPALEDYQILREVGRGGMGIVYEAVQRSLDRRVALKVLSLGAAPDPRHLQRFKNEAQAAAQL